MMKIFARVLALLMMMTFALPVFAATPTPPPISIPGDVAAVPQEIQKVLDIAYNEWETLAGKTLSKVNKYTEWRGKGVGFGWCAGFATWCMLEAGIPQEEIEPILDMAKASPDGIFHASGTHHVMEANVAKNLQGYMAMGRTTNIPQPGFLVVYGCSYNKTIHLGVVYDVQLLENGLYRITTIEGNMSSRVKMYIRDYDLGVEVNTNSKKSTNLFEIPEDERVIPESDHVDYSVPSAKPSSSANGKYAYYVNRFLMPWVPGDPTLTYDTADEATPAPTAEPTAEPTLTPTAEPAPAQTEAPVTEAPATEAPATEVPATEVPATEAPAVTPAPETETGGRATYPCHGKGGKCPYITYHADDLFCRSCDRNDNGVEDSEE